MAKELMMDGKQNLKAAQSEITVARLISVARDLFSERPYVLVSTEEIVKAAGVTRGALYHHFGSKDDLFMAVFEEIQKEIGDRVVAAASAGQGAWGDFLAGCRAFLESCLDPKIQRIVFIEAPSVMGWERWRSVDAANSLRALKEGLAELEAAGILSPQPLEALAHILSGAMNEAALWIAQAEAPEEALEEALTSLQRLLEGIRTR